MANLVKCRVAMSKVTYLGYHIGCSLVKLVVNKMQAFKACPVPQTKSQSDVFLAWQDITDGLSPSLPQSRPRL